MRVPVGVRVSVGDSGVLVCVGVCVAGGGSGVLVDVRVPVMVRVGVRVRVAVDSGRDVAVRVSVGGSAVFVGVRVGVGVRVDVNVRVGVAVRVPVRVRVSVGPPGVTVKVGVNVASRAVLVGVTDAGNTVCVIVEEGVGVDDGTIPVGEPVAVGVFVAVTVASVVVAVTTTVLAVRVGVSVGVSDPVGVWLWVTFCVGVGVRSENRRKKPGKSAADNRSSPFVSAVGQPLLPANTLVTNSSRSRESTMQSQFTSPGTVVHGCERLWVTKNATRNSAVTAGTGSVRSRTSAALMNDTTLRNPINCLEPTQRPSGSPYARSQRGLQWKIGAAVSRAPADERACRVPPRPDEPLAARRPRGGLRWQSGGSPRLRGYPGPAVVLRGEPR